MFSPMENENNEEIFPFLFICDLTLKWNIIAVVIFIYILMHVYVDKVMRQS